MNESLDPKVAARKTVARFEELARDTEVPQAMRDLAERSIAQMRETLRALQGCAGRGSAKLGEILRCD
jgi:uncharacterized protein (UPF0147 family)